MMWQNDITFWCLADILWPEDVELAESRRKGFAAARRRMESRYEGFYGFRKLAQRRKQLENACADVRLVLG